MKDEIAGTIYAKAYTEWRIKCGGYAKDKTLRDEFAGLAMQTMLGWDNDHNNWGNYADYAYKMADAMLKERAK